MSTHKSIFLSYCALRVFLTLSIIDEKNLWLRLNSINILGLPCSWYVLLVLTMGVRYWKLNYFTVHFVYGGSRETCCIGRLLAELGPIFIYGIWARTGSGLTFVLKTSRPVLTNFFHNEKRLISFLLIFIGHDFSIPVLKKPEWKALSRLVSFKEE